MSRNTGTGNLQGEADAVKTMLAKGKHHYSAACRKRAEECYDKEKCFEEYVGLYESFVLG